MDQRRLKTWLSIGAQALLLLGFASEAQSLEGKVWAEVNQVPITVEAVDEATRVYLYQIGHRRLSPSRMRDLKRKLLKGLIEEELLYQEGLKKDWVVSEKDLETGVKRIRDRFTSEGAFISAIKKEHLTLDDLREGIRRFVLIRKTRESISRLSPGAQVETLQQITENSTIKIHEE